MKSSLLSQPFMFVVSVVCLISMTAILSDYAGALKVTIGSGGVHLQIEGDAHHK
jgi:hypothetical protein